MHSISHSPFSSFKFFAGNKFSFITLDTMLKIWIYLIWTLIQTLSKSGSRLKNIQNKKYKYLIFTFTKNFKHSALKERASS